jgi:hypothetical protein
MRSSLGDWLAAALDRKLPAADDWLCADVLEFERDLDKSAAVNASQADWTRRRCISFSCCKDDTKTLIFLIFQKISDFSKKFRFFKHNFRLLSNKVHTIMWLSWSVHSLQFWRTMVQFPITLHSCFSISLIHVDSLC